METPREGFWEEKEQTWGLCLPLSSRGLCYVLSLWEPRGFQGVLEKGGWGKTGWTMFTRPLHSFSCATPGLFCSPEAAVKPIKKWQVRPQWDNNTNPLPPHQLLCTPKPLATKTRAGGERSEGEKRRCTEKEDCTLQWLPHSGAVAPRCVNAAECFQFPSTLSPRRVRINRTNERRKVTGCERRPEKREKGNNSTERTKLERTFSKCTQRKIVSLKVCSFRAQET